MNQKLPSYHVLVVDDEKDLVNLVRYNLEKAGYSVSGVYSGTDVDLAIRSQVPDLIILDLMLPDRSGYDICKDLKASPSTRSIPVIMLTARSSEDNRVRGFEYGVEDYVVKPFSPKELVLRVKALLTRTTLQHTQNNSIKECAGIYLDALGIFPDEQLVTVNSVPVALSATEYKILLALASSPNKVYSREQLIQLAWKEQNMEDILDRTVDTQVKRLRAKLGEAKEMIKTIRGSGYCLCFHEKR